MCTVFNRHKSNLLPLKHKWEPSLLIVPISLHSTEVSCRARLLLLRPASFPVFHFAVYSPENVCPDPSFRFFTTGFPMVRCSSAGLLPQKRWRTKRPLVLRTGHIAASLRWRNGSGFRLHPFPESFRTPKLPDYLSAFRLNLPKNTLQWLAFVGFLRCYPSFPRLRLFRQAGFHLCGPFRIPVKYCFSFPTFRAVFYRSPDESKIPTIFHFSKFFPTYFTQRNTPLFNRSY